MWLNCSEDSDIEDIINNFYFGAGSNIFLNVL